MRPAGAAGLVAERPAGYDPVHHGHRHFAGPRTMCLCGGGGTTLAGEFIDIPARDGGTFQGYLALPEGGKGPGLMILQEIFGVNEAIRATSDYFAEEGYVVLAPDMFHRLQTRVELGYSDAEFATAFDYLGKFDFAKAVEDMGATLDHLKGMDAVEGQGKGATTQVAALGYCLGGALAYQAAAHCEVDAAVSYYGVYLEQQLHLKDRIACPMVMHFGGADDHVPMEAVGQIREAFAGADHVLINVYEGAPHAFANRFRDCYDKAAAGMAHSRTIALLRAVMGPSYDLERLWEMHCYYEFATRDVDATMGTMVAEPYVNHIPTMTGGVGHAELHRFYKHHFRQLEPGRYRADSGVAHRGRRPGGGRDDLRVHPRPGDRLDAARRGADRQAGPHPAGRHHQLPRPEAVPRAHLLGPRLRSWCRSACSIRRICRSRVSRARRRCSTRAGRPTR